MNTAYILIAKTDSNTLWMDVFFFQINKNGVTIAPS